MERKQHGLPFKVAKRQTQVPFEMKLQVIRSKGRARRLFVNVPLALAAALDMQPGERLRWQLLNRSDLRLIRLDAPASEKPSKN
jgi:hypothetical protein